MFGPRISAYAFWLTVDIHTDIYILEKWFPLKSQQAHSLYFVIQLSPPFHLRFLVVLLDERAISGVDLIEMTLKDGIVASVHTTVTTYPRGGGARCARD